MKAGVIGSGMVGEVLADGLLQHGHQVMRGSRKPEGLADWKERAGADASIGTFQQTAEYGELVVLAVKGTAAEAVVTECAAALGSKPVVDTTNPIDERPPEGGVLHFFTQHDESLLERLQRRAPEARFVKAFSSVGSALMVHPKLAGGPPTMFICGNDAPAKAQVKSILDQFGWETADLGAAPAARAIEPLCMLWCIPGFTQGSWTHAFKLLR